MREITISYISGMLQQLVLPSTHNLTPYIVQTVLNGESNYSISSLMDYLQACNAQMEIRDIMDESYIIKDVREVHDTIILLIEKYKVKMSRMNEAIGVIYTPATKGKTPLSINTFIAILNYFKCEISFI